MRGKNIKGSVITEDDRLEGLKEKTDALQNIQYLIPEMLVGMQKSESRMMTVKEEGWLLRWEKKILRNIYGAVREEESKEK